MTKPLPKLALVGWRGMVGSVLLERMRLMGDFAGFETTFFSTSQQGAPAPFEAHGRVLGDAYDINALRNFDVIITCQGGDYTKAMHAPLRQAGFDGYWIDAASTLRMAPEAVIVLDPINGESIKHALDAGKKDFIGGNCTVSLMLMAIGALFAKGWVEWVSVMTYQAASGAGAANMKELVAGMGRIFDASNLQDDILKIDQDIIEAQRNQAFPQALFGAPLAGSLIPYIDAPLASGQSKEEWKGQVETNKILDTKHPIIIDGLCVRVGAMRCHSQGLTIKLKEDIPLDAIYKTLEGSNDWLDLVPDDKQQTLERLTPVAVSGTLTVALGRVRKLAMGGEYLGAFTVGDQLLWGAAEPLRRILALLKQEGHV